MGAAGEAAGARGVPFFFSEGIPVTGPHALLEVSVED